MREYGMLHALPLSFFSRPFYQDVAHNWRGTGLLYLLLLLAAAWVPLTIALQAWLSRLVTTSLLPFADQIPPITIRHGQATVEAKQPCLIKDPATNRVAIILDTTGDITSLEGSQASLLLTRTKLFVRRGPHHIAVHDLAAFGTLHISREVVVRLALWLKGPLLILAYPLAVLCSYAYLLLQATVCAGLGLILAREREPQFNYQTSLRLAILATTPSVVIATAAGLLGLRAPVFLGCLAGLALTLAYLYFAIKASLGPRVSDLGASPDVPSFSP